MLRAIQNLLGACRRTLTRTGNDDLSRLFNPIIRNDNEVTLYCVREKPDLFDDPSGRRALLFLVLHANIETIKSIAEINQKIFTCTDNEGNAFSHIAADMGRGDVFRFLEETNPALLDVENNAGQTARSLYFELSIPAIRPVATLKPELEVPYKQSLWRAIYKDQTAVVLVFAREWPEMFLVAGSGVGLPPVEIMPHFSSVKTIIETEKIYPQILAHKDFLGNSFLHRAAAAGRQDIVEAIGNDHPDLLLSKNPFGQTPETVLSIVIRQRGPRQGPEVLGL